MKKNHKSLGRPLKYGKVRAERMNIIIGAETRDLLETEAARTGVSLSHVINEALVHHLTQDN